MNNTLKKTLAAILTVAMMVTGTALLVACGNKTATTDSTAADTTNATVVLTQDAGATASDAAAGTAAGTTAAAIVAPKVLPSVAPATLTINGVTVPAAEYDFYYYTIYSNYAQYASYGAVPTSAADGSFDLAAACSLAGYETKTWGDYIKDSALKQLQDTYILAAYAAEAGMTITEAGQSTIDSFYTSVQTYADSSSLSLDAYLTTMYGDQISKATLDPIIVRYLVAGDFMTSLEKDYTFTDAELQTFYTANADSYTNTDLPKVRHILYWAPAGIASTTDATAEELAAAKAAADATLAQVKSYDDMVALGDTALADASATESAEYTVATGDMVAEFETWCYDTARKPGDTGIVQTEYGYHVMFYVGSEKDWTTDAISALTTEKYEAYMTEQEALPQFVLAAA